MNIPRPMGQHELAIVLRDMADRVTRGDSFEGSIEYLMPTEEIVPDGTYALVMASYRIGNIDGQGGVRLINGNDWPLMCPHCGRRFAECDLIPTHDWPVPTRQVCPGSGQVPRDAHADRRPLWKDGGVR